MKKTAVALLTFLTFASGAYAQQTVPVTNDFFPGGITWSNGQGGYLVRFTVFPDAKGTMVLCGASAIDGHSTASLSRRAAKTLRFFLNDKPVLKDVSWFTRAKSKNALIGTPAACRSTGVAYPRGQGNSVSVHSTQRNFRD